MEYSKYFLTEDYLLKNIKFLNKDLLIKREKKEINSTSKNYDYEVREGNKFLKYFLILYNGIDKYEWEKLNNFDKEEKEKIKIIENIRINKSKLKMLKISKNKLENNLLENELSLENFINLCLFYDISLIVKIKNIYSYINPKNDINPEYIERNENNNYLLKLYDDNKKKLEYNKIEKNGVLVNNIIKPFKNITDYKLCDLKEIAEKLKLGVDEKDRKKDLYSKMLNYLK